MGYLSHDYLKTVLLENGIDQFGYLSFEKALPLRECFAKKRMADFFREKEKSPKLIIPLLIPYRFEEKGALPTCVNEGFNLSEYAKVKDYHFVVENLLDAVILKLNKLYKNADFIQFSDNSPFYEVRLASLAGLGVHGDNGLLINEKYGSWVFIAEIVTDLELQSEKTETEKEILPDLVPDSCIKCRKCIEACPAECLTPKLSESGEWKGKISFDKERCLSALTQRKGVIDDEGERTLLQKGNSVWGCDICQKVCPMNKGKAIKPHKGFEGSFIPRVDESLVDSLENRAWNWRKNDVIKRNMEILRTAVKADNPERED